MARAQSTPSFIRRLASSGIWALLGRVASIVTVLINYRLICERLGDDVAVYVICAGLAGLGTLVAGAGLSTALLRRFSSQDTAHTALNRKSLLLRVLALSAIAWLLVSASLFLLTAFLPNFFARPISGLVGLIALWVLGRTVLTIIAEALRSVQKFSLSAMYGGLQEGPYVNLSILACLLVYPAGMMDAPKVLAIHAVVTCFVAVLGTAQAFQVIAARDAERSKEGEVATINTGMEESTSAGVKVSASPPTTREIASESMKVLVSQMAIFGIVEFETLLVGKYCTDVEIGAWGAIRRVISVVSGPLLLINAAIPSFVAELYSKGDMRRLEKLLRFSSTIATPPACIAFMLIFLFGKQILGYFDPSFEVGYPSLTILAASNIVFVAAGSAGLTLKMANRQGWATVSTLILAVAYVLVAPVTAQRYGLVGIAVLSSVLVLARNVISTLLVKYFLNLWCVPSLSLEAIADFRQLLQQKRKRAKGKKGLAAQAANAESVATESAVETKA